MRTKITLACTECKQRNYNTTKEKKNHPDRMEVRKYCRFCRKHTVHKETKQFLRNQITGVSRRGWKGLVQMGDSAEKKAMPGFFKGVKVEFKKIIWPDRQATLKQSVAVVAISVVVGVIIALIDYVAKFGVNFITSIQGEGDYGRGKMVCSPYLLRI